MFPTILLNFFNFYRLSNSDTTGGHYHSASGSVNQIVRGRYGSRSPANNRIEEVTYTAGPRGLVRTYIITKRSIYLFLCYKHFEIINFLRI